MSDQSVPSVTYEVYNPAIDEAPVGGDADCDGVMQEEATDEDEQ